MEKDGGGWLVFQRRVDGREDFYRNWADYEFGFGNQTHEFWLGLLPLHTIVSQARYELLIDLQDLVGNTTFARYKTFSISGCEEDYTLMVSGYSGNAGDHLNKPNGQKFSTKDKDNDAKEISPSCTDLYRGGWWYKNCGQSNLNGVHFNVNSTEDKHAIFWGKYSLSAKIRLYMQKRTEMKIRRM